MYSFNYLKDPGSEKNGYAIYPFAANKILWSSWFEVFFDDSKTFFIATFKFSLSNQQTWSSNCTRNFIKYNSPFNYSPFRRWANGKVGHDGFERHFHIGQWRFNAHKRYLFPAGAGNILDQQTNQNIFASNVKFKI